jgi:hypothetical protein
LIPRQSKVFLRSAELLAEDLIFVFKTNGGRRDAGSQESNRGKVYEWWRRARGSRRARKGRNLNRPRSWKREKTDRRRTRSGKDGITSSWSGKNGIADSKRGRNGSVCSGRRRNRRTDRTRRTRRESAGSRSDLGRRNREVSRLRGTIGHFSLTPSIWGTSGSRNLTMLTLAFTDGLSFVLLQGLFRDFTTFALVLPDGHFLDYSYIVVSDGFLFLLNTSRRERTTFLHLVAPNTATRVRFMDRTETFQDLRGGRSLLTPGTLWEAED